MSKSAAYPIPLGRKAKQNTLGFASFRWLKLIMVLANPIQTKES